MSAVARLLDSAPELTASCNDLERLTADAVIECQACGDVHETPAGSPLTCPTCGDYRVDIAGCDEVGCDRPAIRLRDVSVEAPDRNGTDYLRMAFCEAHR